MIELKMYVADEHAATVRELLKLIPTIKIVSETSCVEPKKDVKKVKENYEITSGAFRPSSKEEKRKLFIEKCKEVVNKIAELNGERMTVNIKGKLFDYVAQFDADNCRNVLDKLYENHESYIDNYLSSVQKPTGISIVLPFVGKIIDCYAFSSQQSIHKERLTEKLKEIYNKDTIEGYLSFDGRKRSSMLKDLMMKVVDIALELGVAHLD